jgi:hypothetical protein
LTDLSVLKTGRPNIWLNFYMPVLVVIAVNIGTFIATSQALVLESFMLATVVLGIIMIFQRVDNLSGMMKYALAVAAAASLVYLIQGFI